MNNFLFPWEMSEQPVAVKVTPLKPAEPTPEEYEQAMDEFYNEIYQGHWRFNK